MGNSDDAATSLTLLGVLCQPEKDEQAWGVFYQRYQPMIGRWCARFRLQAADVEDVSQKVLQRVFTRIGTYNPQRGERFRGWLKTVVENAVRDLLRTAGRRRFLQETEITARLEHPGVVPVYGLVQDADGNPCYAMRFIRGESLNEAIRRFHEPTGRAVTRASGAWLCATCSAGSWRFATRSPTRTAAASCTAT
jgi:RNA polymerase sigma factor (sigma-70 family)